MPGFRVYRDCSYNQGIQTRTLKVVPLKVPPDILLIWPSYSLKDPQKGAPKPKGTTLRVRGSTPGYKA